MGQCNLNKFLTNCATGILHTHVIYDNSYDHRSEVDIPQKGPDLVPYYDCRKETCEYLHCRYCTSYIYLPIHM